jgi:hypothetical protein
MSGNCLGNRSSGRKSTPVPLRPPKMKHDLAWDRTQGAAVGSLSYGTARNDRRRPKLFLFPAPGCRQIGTAFSLCSGYQACFVSTTSPVLISVMLIENFNGVPQSLESNVLDRPRLLISFQTYNSQTLFIRLCET